MLHDIFKSVMSNFQKFLVAWIIVILLNQLFIFGACFAPVCIMAALPHTGIIAALFIYFGEQENDDFKTICNNCKKENDKNAKFCAYCGDKLSNDGTANLQTKD